MRRPKLFSFLVGVLVAPLAAFANGGMFGELLPQNTAVFAINDGVGGETLYAVSATLPLSEIGDGESWAAYVARVNEEQGLPSRTLEWVVLNDEPVLDQTVPDESGQTEGAALEFKIGWGWVGDLAIDGTFIPDRRVVVRVEEFSFVGSGAIARLVSAAGYPASTANAWELLEKRTVKVFPAPRPLNGDLLGTLLGHLYIQVAYPGESVDVSGGQNAAGYQCVLGRNKREQDCAKDHADDHKACVIQHGECHLAGTSCAILSGCPPCALACVGANLVICATVTQDCRNDADMVRDSCDNDAKSQFDFCCDQEGVECGAGA